MLTQYIFFQPFTFNLYVFVFEVLFLYKWHVVVSILIQPDNLFIFSCAGSLLGSALGLHAGFL